MGALFQASLVADATGWVTGKGLHTSGNRSCLEGQSRDFVDSNRADPFERANSCIRTVSAVARFLFSECQTGRPSGTDLTRCSRRAWSTATSRHRRNGGRFGNAAASITGPGSDRCPHVWTGTGTDREDLATAELTQPALAHDSTCPTADSPDASGNDDDDDDDTTRAQQFHTAQQRDRRPRRPSRRPFWQPSA